MGSATQDHEDLCARSFAEAMNWFGALTKVRLKPIFWAPENFRSRRPAKVNFRRSDTARKS